jgi:hypothetical protein
VAGIREVSVFERVAWIVAGLMAVTAAHADDPQWLKDARAREGKLVAPREVVSTDKWLKVSLPAKVKGKVEKNDNSYVLEIDFGSPTSMYCAVVPEGFDLADMLRITLDAALKEVAATQGNVEKRQLEAVESGAYGNVAWLNARWLYLVKGANGPNLGAYNHVVMSKDGHGVSCALNEIGYTKTVSSVMKALAETLQVKDVGPSPYYHEISVLKMGNSPVGVSSISLTRDADGDTQALQSSSLLLPAGGGNVTTQDAFHKEWIRPDDTLINAIHVIASNGEVTSNLSLKPVEDVWTIDGEMQGKAFSQKLKPDDVPGTGMQQARALRAILAGDKATGAVHTIPMWVSADPTRLHDATTKIGAKVGDQHEAQLTMASLKMDLVLDANGMASGAKMQMGPQVVVIERVYVDGKF